MTTIIRQCVGIDTAKDEFVASLATMNQAFEITHKSTKSFSNSLAGGSPARIGTYNLLSNPIFILARF